MKLKKLSLLFLLFSLFIFSANAQPQGDEGDIQEFVVTGTRVPLEVSKAGPGVTVITSEEIDIIKPQSVIDILKSVPGIYINESGAGKLAVLNIRGGNDGMSMIMVDGVQVYDASSASDHFDISSIPIDNIERIEIVKGPVSASLGSGAMNGAVNIITKKGSNTPVNASADIQGSLWKNNFRGSASLYGGNDKIQYRLSGSGAYDEGISTYSRSATYSKDEKDKDAMGAFSAYIGYKPCDNLETSLSLNYADKYSDLDNAGSDDPDFTQRLRRFGAVYNVKYKLNDFWAPSLKLFYTLQDRTYNNEKDPLLETDWNMLHMRYKGQTAGFDFQNDFYIIDEFILTAGVSYQNEKAKVIDHDLGDANSFNKNKNKSAGYLQGTVELFDAWTTVLAVRGDKDGKTDFTPTYRVSTIYDIKPIDFQLKAAFGTGFNAPSLYQLYTPLYDGGNKDLKPQHSIGYELGITNGIADRKIRWGVTWFDNYYKDLINWGANGYENISRSHIRGIESELGIYPVKQFNIKGSYTWTEAKDSDGIQYFSTPVHKYKISATLHPYDPFKFYAEVLFMSKRVSGNFKTVPSTVLNLAASYDFTKSIQLYVKGSNVTDLDYEINPRYAAKGIEVFAGLKLKI